MANSINVPKTKVTTSLETNPYKNNVKAKKNNVLMFLIALLTMNGHHNHFNMRQIAIADSISMSNEDPSVKDFASYVPI